MEKNFEKETWEEFNEAFYTKKLVLFGASSGCKKFFDKYSEQYKVYGIVDNSPKKWGKQFLGVEISSPQILLNEIKDEIVPEYKIYIRHYNSDIAETVLYATI